jgi:hypothetical protein
MTIALTRTDQKTILPAFAHALTCVPNLYTLELVHVHSQMSAVLGVHFGEFTFPQIRRIILPSCAHHILRACPEVLEVVCNEDDGSTIVGAIAKACRHVELVQGISSGEALIRRR